MCFKRSEISHTNKRRYCESGLVAIFCLILSFISASSVKQLLHIIIRIATTCLQMGLDFNAYELICLYNSDYKGIAYNNAVKFSANDCLVSEWSQWTTCSATCGYGEKIRYRTIIRKKKRGGRSCPPLTEKEHCGKVNSCFHIDYFDW